MSAKGKGKSGKASGQVIVSGGKHKSNLKAPSKEAAIPEVLGLSPSRMHKYALKMLDPLGQPECNFPSVLPGRSGSATFPIVIDIAAGASPRDFGVILTPNTDEPVKVTRLTAPAPSTTETYHTAWYFEEVLNGRATTAGGSFGSFDVVGTVEGPNASNMYLSLPFYQNGAGLVDATLKLRELVEPGSALVKLYGFNGGGWVQLMSATLNSGGSTTTGVDFSAYQFVTVTCVRNSGRATTYNVDCDFLSQGVAAIAPTSLSDSSVMDIHVPEWASLLAAASEVRVVAMTALLTYVGAPLEGSGVVAACNAPQDMPITNTFYETISQRPFDRYDGRLMANGPDEGGAHWHYVPDDPLALRMQDIRSEEVYHRMCGYFGVQGLAANQNCRLRVAITLNFFSLEPQYSMTFAPPFQEFSYLISAMRMHIPLVSSNDGHIKKFKNLAKMSVKRGLDYAIQNPQAVARLLQLAALAI